MSKKADSELGYPYSPYGELVSQPHDSSLLYGLRIWWAMAMVQEHPRSGFVAGVMMYNVSDAHDTKCWTVKCCTDQCLAPPEKWAGLPIMLATFQDICQTDPLVLNTPMWHPQPMNRSKLNQGLEGRDYGLIHTYMGMGQKFRTGKQILATLLAHNTSHVDKYLWFIV